MYDMWAIRRCDRKWESFLGKIREPLVFRRNPISPASPARRRQPVRMDCAGIKENRNETASEKRGKSRRLFGMTNGRVYYGEFELIPQTLQCMCNMNQVRFRVGLSWQHCLPSLVPAYTCFRVRTYKHALITNDETARFKRSCEGCVFQIIKTLEMGSNAQ